MEDIGNHLAALDCLVQVSPREGNSLTLMEAMYVGVPIVTTRVGAVAEFERAAGQRLFWSVSQDPTAGEIAVCILQAMAATPVRAHPSASMAHDQLSGYVMAAQWTTLVTALHRKSGHFSSLIALESKAVSCILQAAKGLHLDPGFPQHVVKRLLPASITRGC